MMRTDDNDPAMQNPEGRKVITRKRRKLAKLIAAGYTQADAYETAYKTQGGSRNAHKQNGHQIAKLPEVQQLIRDYEEELLPLGDIRVEQEQALSHLKAIAYNGLDERIRMQATIALYHLLETHRETEERLKARRPVTHSIPVDAVVSELLQLAESQPAIELETVDSETAEEHTETDSEPAEETD
jgi:hypothetical protein